MPTPVRPSRDAVEQELARLCETDVMRRSPSHTRLLRYLVDAALAGDDAALRETAIAVAVFRRDPSTYDPQTDPIVRVTAGRLRGRLDAHYATLDAPTALRIALPRGGYAPQFTGRVPRRAPPEGIAVLRVRNASGDASLEPFCLALAERVADALAVLGVPRVVSRESVDRAQQRATDPADAGRLLGVEWVLDTAVSDESAGELRVTARLVGVDDGGVRWVETAARDAAQRHAAADLVVDRIVARFAAALRGAPYVPDRGGPRPSAAAVPVQVDLVRFLLRQRSPDSVAKAIALAEAATAEHPGCAAAWAELGNARLVATGFMDQDCAVQFEAALAATQRALALDPANVTARVTEGALVGVYLCDPVRAITLLREATRAAPRHAYARVNLAVMLQYTGAFDDAIAELEVARSYDPLAAYPVTNIAVALAFARRHDEARRAWEVARAAGSPPMLAAHFQGMNELWAGEPERAREHFRDAAERAPDHPLPSLCAAMADAASGHRARALARVEATRARHPRVSHFNLAMVAAALRDREGVLRELEHAASARDALLASAPVEPTFDWLARDRAFNAFLRARGLGGWCGAAPPRAVRCGATARASR